MTAALTALLLAASPTVVIQVAPLVSADRAVTRSTLDLLTNQIAAEVAKHRGLRTFGPADLEALLRAGKTGEALSCQVAAERCLLELAGALGASLLVAGDVTPLDAELAINLRLTSLKHHVVLANLTRVARREGEAPLEAIRALVPELLTQAKAASPSDLPLDLRDEVPAAALARQSTGVPIGAWLLGGAGVALLTGGGVLVAVGTATASGVVLSAGPPRVINAGAQSSANTLGDVGQGLLVGGVVALATAAVWTLAGTYGR